MKKKLFFLVIYLLGCINAYLSFRSVTKTELNGEWTKKDRAFGIFISGGSWLTVVAVAGVVFINHLDSKDPAKW